MVDGLMLALEHPNAVGESFNIGNARSAVTIYDLAQRIKRLTGCPGEIVFQPLHYTDVELRIPNIQKARELLGFEARVDLDDGSRADDRVVSREARHARVSEPIRLARPDVGAAELAAIGDVLASGQLTMGPKVPEFEALLARPAAPRTRSPSRPARPPSISRCSRSGSAPGTR